ncbi:hypothetical protein PNOK_0900700 [Pyrrhoderma noxium]|uniref:Uncharacterized protein n=1 Tax=Pyrrhoderma noxium TaxID=2282107 RepID=A0A286U6P6_9AGAM|nr:hypothetical protein PNOK_0900700 [Pyrrhoderma noxium]
MPLSSLLFNKTNITNDVSAGIGNLTESHSEPSDMPIAMETGRNLPSNKSIQTKDLLNRSLSSKENSPQLPSSSSEPSSIQSSLIQSSLKNPRLDVENSPNLLSPVLSHATGYIGKVIPFSKLSPVIDTLDHKTTTTFSIPPTEYDVNNDLHNSNSDYKLIYDGKESSSTFSRPCTPVPEIPLEESSFYVVTTDLSQLKPVGQSATAFTHVFVPSPVRGNVKRSSPNESSDILLGSSPTNRIKDLATDKNLCTSQTPFFLIDTRPSWSDQYFTVEASRSRETSVVSEDLGSQYDSCAGTPRKSPFLSAFPEIIVKESSEPTRQVYIHKKKGERRKRAAQKREETRERIRGAKRASRLNGGKKSEDREE